MPAWHSGVQPTDVVSVFAPRFAAAQVEWMVTGGVAAILYGEPRLTQDIDVVVVIGARDVARFADQFPESGGEIFASRPSPLSKRAQHRQRTRRPSQFRAQCVSPPPSRTSHDHSS